MKLLTRAFDPDIDSAAEVVMLFEEFMQTIPTAIHGREVDRDQLIVHLATVQALYLAFEDDKMVGIMGLLTAQQPFLKDVKICHEMPWYIRPCVSRTALWRRMLKDYELWAVEQGCDGIVIGKFDDRLTPVYKRMGYAPHNATMTKRIK